MEMLEDDEDALPQAERLKVKFLHSAKGPDNNNNNEDDEDNDEQEELTAISCISSTSENRAHLNSLSQHVYDGLSQVAARSSGEKHHIHSMYTCQSVHRTTSS